MRCFGSKSVTITLCAVSRDTFVAHICSVNTYVDGERARRRDCLAFHLRRFAAMADKPHLAPSHVVGHGACIGT